MNSHSLQPVQDPDTTQIDRQLPDILADADAPASADPPPTGSKSVDDPPAPPTSPNRYLVLEMGPHSNDTYLPSRVANVGYLRGDMFFFTSFFFCHNSTKVQNFSCTELFVTQPRLKKLE